MRDLSNVKSIDELTSDEIESIVIALNDLRELGEKYQIIDKSDVKGIEKAKKSLMQVEEKRKQK